MHSTNILTALHQELLAADAAYSENATRTNHLAVSAAQRAYYAALRRWLVGNANANANAPYLWVRRAQLLHKRAQLNRRREKQDETWQDIALHQVQRARRVLMIARAQADQMSPEAPPRATPAPPPKAPRPKRTRTIHPITGRYVYSD